MEADDLNQVGFVTGLLHGLKLTKDEEVIYPFWQQIAREAVKHIKSYTFREEFFKLIRNDDIHLRLLSLHMFLLADAVTHLNRDPSAGWRNAVALRQAQYRLGQSRYPMPFKLFLYKHF